MSHSPGPWRWDDFGGFIVDAASKYPIRGQEWAIDNEADKALIVAAPEMLELLRELVAAASQRHELDVMRMAVALSSRAQGLLDRIAKAGK